MARQSRHEVRVERETCRSTRRAGSRRRRGERGVALVEAAIITPLLMMLVFGIIEFGFAFKDSLTLANGSRAGARVGSAAGIDPTADYAILQAVRGATGSLANVDLIVVFKASGPTASVPSACVSTGAQAGLCNVYVASDMALSQSSFLSAGYSKDDSWAASSRVTSLTSTSGPDYLGVYVRGQHNSIFQLIVPSRKLSDSVIMRLEPTR